MKQIGIIILLFLISGITYGQENSEFVNKIKRLVIQDRIPIYNTNYERLKNDEISREFVWIDTIINDIWTRPKFIDNIYKEPFDGIAIKSLIVLDTVSDKVNSNYISFIKEEHDDSGNFIRERIVFKIDKRIIPKMNKESRISKKKKGKLKRICKKWKTVEIRRLGEKIELDSCHKLFRIEFDENSFQQYYLPSNYECFTEEMKNDLIVGLEGDPENLYKYYNKIDGHYIENQTGKWYRFEDNLILESEEGIPIVTFVIEKLRNKILYLKSDELNYEIKLKKASR